MSNRGRGDYRKPPPVRSENDAKGDKLISDVLEIKRCMSTLLFNSRIILHTLDGPRCATCNRGNKKYVDPAQRRFSVMTTTQQRQNQPPRYYNKTLAPEPQEVTSPQYDPSPSVVSNYIQNNNLQSEDGGHVYRSGAPSPERVKKSEKPSKRRRYDEASSSSSGEDSSSGSDSGGGSN